MIAIVAPGAGAAEESVTVQRAEPPVFREDGVHVKALIPIVVARDTVPPAAVTVPAPPAGVAPIALITLTAVLTWFGLRVNDRTATTPFAIIFALIP